MDLRAALEQAAITGKPLDLREFPAASLTSKLLREIVCREHAQQRTLALAFATLDEPLDLEAAAVRLPVTFLKCVFNADVRLNEAQSRSVTFFGCELLGLAARGLRASGDLKVVDCEVAGMINLRAARIAGELNLSDTAIEAREDPRSLVAENMIVEGDAHLSGGFTALKSVRLAGARVDGQLELSQASLKAEDEPALAADQLTVGHGLYLDDIDAAGAVHLGGADIGGQLTLNGSRVGVLGGVAVFADAVRVAMDAYLTFNADGAVTLLGASIGGELSLRGAQLGNGRRAVVADNLEVGGVLYLDGGFTAKGMVRLLDARIGQALQIDAAEFDGGDGVALAADGVRASALFCEEGFRSHGEVRFVHAQISGNASFDAAVIDVPAGDGLSFDRASVGGTLAFGPAFESNGRVSLAAAHLGRVEFADATVAAADRPAIAGARVQIDEDLTVDRAHCQGGLNLVGARIRGRVEVRESRLVGSAGGAAVDWTGVEVGQGVAFHATELEGEIRLDRAEVRGQVDLAGARISAGLSARDLRCQSLDITTTERPAGVLDLRGASVGRLVHRPYLGATDWPSSRLRELRYDAIDSGEPARTEGWLAWLESDVDFFAPQPFEQLALVLRQNGDEETARQVLIAKQRARRREALSPPQKVWSAFLGATVGYGYRLWLAGVWLALFLLAGSVLFGAVFDPGRSAHSDLVAAVTPPARPVAFQPVLYTTDVLVPVLDLGQQASWRAQRAAQWVAAALTVVGWLLTTAFVGGLASRRQ